MVKKPRAVQVALKARRNGNKSWSMSPKFSRGFAAIHRNKTRFISPQALETAIAAPYHAPPA
jgi:hypothetical protein